MAMVSEGWGKGGCVRPPFQGLGLFRVLVRGHIRTHAHLFSGWRGPRALELLPEGVQAWGKGWRWVRLLLQARWLCMI